MLRRIQQTVRERHLISPDVHIIAGVSGGADSTAMLYALWFLTSKIPFKLSVAHLHHGLRGSDADKDAEIVEQLCFRLNVPFVLKKEQVEKTRQRRGVSFEMAAREARHDFFKALVIERKADAVAVAHTKNDQAETILMRLLSGTGPDGLSGMAYQNEPFEGLRVIRPLLDVSRDAIESFLRDHGIVWREDKTNRDTQYVRSRMRHGLFPQLAELGFPHAPNALVRLGEIMREESSLQAAQTHALIETCRSPEDPEALSLDALHGLVLAEQRRVIRMWLISFMPGSRAIEFNLIERILRLTHRATDGELMINPSLRVRKQGRQLHCCEQAEAPSILSPVKLAMPGVTELPEAGLTVRVTRSHGYWRSQSNMDQYPAVAYIDRPDQHVELFARARLPGDAMTPTGMKGRVFLKDLFINKKVPVERRGLIPVLATEKEPVWVAGYRVAEAWSVSSDGAPSWKIVIEQKGR